MSENETPKVKNGFCIYIDTLCQGPVPVVSEDDHYVVFKTELEAQREIVDYMLTRLQEFLDGHREYDDAISVDEYVMPVTVHPDGTITDETGGVFGPNVE